MQTDIYDTKMYIRLASNSLQAFYSYYLLVHT